MWCKMHFYDIIIQNCFPLNKYSANGHFCTFAVWFVGFFYWRIIFVTLLHTLWIITWLKDLGRCVGILARDVKKEFSVLLLRCCHYRAFWVCFSERRSLEQDLASPVGAAGFIRHIPLQILGISGGWRNRRERNHREGSSLSPPIFCHYIQLKKTEYLLHTSVTRDFFFNERSLKKKRLKHIHIYILIPIGQNTAYAPSHGNFLVSKDSYRSCNHH